MRKQIALIKQAEGLFAETDSLLEKTALVCPGTPVVKKGTRKERPGYKRGNAGQLCYFLLGGAENKCRGGSRGK